MNHAVRYRVATIIGTRPEGIKLAPVVRRFAESGAVDSVVISTAQHRGLLDQVLGLFAISPTHDLDLMTPDQSLEDLTSRAIREVGAVLRREAPDLIVVQGDTTTAMVGALTGFYLKCPIAHVEAGLRSGEKWSPYPEEMNRRIVSQLADLHFAPTETSRDNLLSEGVSEDAILVTGNSVVDALLHTASHVTPDRIAHLVPNLRGDAKRLVLVTLHRRESFGPPMERVCTALVRMIEEHEDLSVLFPVHPNPKVRETVGRHLGGIDRIRLCDPLDYLDFVAAMKASYLILTDSGGVQEEAPSLGKPVLVLRDVTERPEVVEAGAARLVGRDPEAVLAAVGELLRNGGAYQKMAGCRNPYGDGHAAERMVGRALEFLEARSGYAGGRSRSK